MEIPKGHQSVMPYLMINGAANFIDFTQKVFTAELMITKMREDKKTIMHSEIQINGSTIMFTDATDKWKPQTANLFIYVNNADETYQRALDNGAATVMELTDEAYGRSCGVTDPFGNVWWITSI